MRLVCVTGRRAADRSARIYEHIRHDLKQTNNDIFLIVPEQFTLNTERALIGYLGARGLIRARVCSPSKLADIVFDALGTPLPVVVDERGLSMAMMRVTAMLRGQLQAFGRSSGFSSFAHQLLGLISEFKQFGVTAQDLQAGARQVTGLLRSKTGDIALLYEHYDQFLQTLQFMDSDDHLHALAAAVPQSPLLRGARVYLDGFDDLPRQSLTLLGALLQVAERVCVSVALPAAPSQDADVFRLGQAMYDELRTLAEQTGAAFTTDIAPAAAPPYAPGIAHLERRLFAFDTPVVPERAGVTLLSAPTLEQEVWAAAEYIHSRVRKEGLRWADCAVVCPDLPAYGPVVSRIFMRCGIPAFIDDRVAVLSHPLFLFVISLLRALAHGMRRDDMLNLIKSGYAQLPDELIDQTEEYLQAIYYRGVATWREPWRRDVGLLSADTLEPVRKTVYELLRAVPSGKRARSGAVWARQLYDLLEHRGIRTQLGEQTDRLAQAGLELEAAVNSRIWNACIELLEQLGAILPDEKMDAGQLAEVLQSALQNLRIGVLPTGLDQVPVGSLARSKLSGVRHLLLLGAGDGAFTQPSQQDMVLSPRDREVLAQLGVPCGRSATMRRAASRHELYACLFSAADGLYISWNTQGDTPTDERAPDLLVRRAAQLLAIDPAHVLRAQDRPFGSAALPGLLHALPQLAQRYTDTEADAAARAMVAALCTQPDGYAQAQALLGGAATAPAEYTIGQLPAALGGLRRVSATQLGWYFTCPFAHYVQYALRPVSWEPFGVPPTQAGSFLHRAMQGYVQAHAQSRLQIGQPDDEQALRLMRKVHASLQVSYQNSLLLSCAQTRWVGENLLHICERAALHYNRLCAQSRFLPADYEMRIGEGKLADIIVYQSADICTTLEGLIDRVDIFPSEDCQCVRIIDYKSSDQKLDTAGAVNATDLQLWLYALAIERARRHNAQDLRIAAAYISPLMDPWAQEDDPNGARKAANKLRLAGWCVDDATLLDADGSQGGGDAKALFASYRLPRQRLAAILGLVDDALIQALRTMEMGQITPRPWRKGDGKRACDTCAFASLCRVRAGAPVQPRELLDAAQADARIDARIKELPHEVDT